jgi:hypothetical protein
VRCESRGEGPNANGQLRVCVWTLYWGFAVAAREVSRAAAVHGGTMQMCSTKRRFAPAGLVGQAVELIRVI